MHGSEPRRWPDEILDGLAEGVVVFDADGAAVTINPVAAEMLGGTEVYIADPRRRFVRQDGSPLPPEERPTAITRATGRAQDGVVVGLLDRGGAPRWIEIATRALGDSDGPPFPVAATFVDVSARVRAQQEARTWAAELERLAAGDAPLVEALFAQSAAGLALLGPD